MKRNQVIEGDCLEVMKEIPDQSIDMVLCDLPYGFTDNKWDSIIPLTPLWEQYRRITKENAAIVLTAAGKFTITLAHSALDLFKYRMIWVKRNGRGFLNANKRPLASYEDILVFYDKQPTYNPQKTPGKPYKAKTHGLSTNYREVKRVRTENMDGKRFPLDVQYFKEAKAEGPIYHPTQKPVGMGQWLIRTFTNPGDVVLDNACGSGSFLVAAKKEGRDYIGIEKNEGHLSVRREVVDCISVCEKRLREVEHTYLDTEQKIEQLSLRGIDV